MTHTAADIRRVITLNVPDNRMEPVTDAETLESLGCDSLSKFELANQLEQHFNIDLDDGATAAWETVADVVRDVQNMLEPQPHTEGDMLSPPRNGTSDAEFPHYRPNLIETDDWNEVGKITASDGTVIRSATRDRMAGDEAAKFANGGIVTNVSLPLIGEIPRAETVMPRTSLYIGARVQLRNGEICTHLDKYEVERMKWTGRRLVNGDLLTWDVYGCYHPSNVHECDIVKVLDGAEGAEKIAKNSEYGKIGKPAINRISRADVERFAKDIHTPEYLIPPTNALDIYQRIAVQSAIYPGKGTPFGLMYVALGLAEAGEVQNKVKKAFRDDGVIDFSANGPTTPSSVAHVQFKPLTPERKAQIMKEMGGALWYLAACCEEIGTTLSEVAYNNLDELCGRSERDTLRGDGDDR